jgi:glutaryl-CoA dehydrogenase (non-decarboxylating)
MQIELTPEQKKAQSEIRDFVDAEIAPYADNFDREEYTPTEVIQKLANQGYLSAIIPKDLGGANMDMITFGILNEQIGRGCSSLRCLLTVHSMMSYALLKWGTKSQKEYWIPKLVTGEVIGAFALSEPNIGSDAKNVATTATIDEDYYILNGRKKWITYGQIADVFVVFVQLEGKLSAFIVEKNTPGLAIKPIFGMLGVKGSMLAELHFDNCRIPQENLVCRKGFGFSHVASSCLDYGRLSVAFGCVGIAQASLEACIEYTTERKQFGVPLKEHQLIRQMITEMMVNVKAARLLCYQAAYLKDIGDPKSIMETSVAKYFASITATKAANDAVQIHGASGCSSEYSVQRYLRDAKIMEIIEGSTQIQQITIADYAYQEAILPSLR